METCDFVKCEDFQMTHAVTQRVNKYISSNAWKGYFTRLLDAFPIVNVIF